MDIWWEINSRTKDQYRDRAKKTLAVLSPEDKKRQDASICTILKKYIQTYDTRAVFIPFGYEANISPFVQQLWQQNKTVLVPQIDEENLRLAVYTEQSIITQWAHKEWIIVDPQRYTWTLDVCLVPWLAFDDQWYRIGHGKWYYDKFLADNACFRIWICYAQSIVHHIPYEDHDQKMDAMVCG